MSNISSINTTVLTKLKGQKLINRNKCRTVNIIIKTLFVGAVNQKREEIL